MSAENDKRLERFITRRSNHVPVIKESRIKSSDIYTLKDRKEQAITKTLENIRCLLSIYEPSLHAAFTDRLHSPEDLLFKNKRKKIIEFATEGKVKGTTTFVKMQGQTLDQAGLLGCKTALFATTVHTEDISQISEQSSSLHLKNLRNLAKDVSNLPSDLFTEVIGVRFNKQGEINTIAEMKPSDHSPYDPYFNTYLCYSFEDGNIMVLSEILGRMKGHKPPSEKVCLKDGNIFRSTAKVTPDVEIEGIMHKLPFESSK